MTKTNPANERIKRAYFIYLREARRLSNASVDEVAKALARFESATGSRDFGKFHREQAVAFKRKLDEAVSIRSGERLSRATVLSTLSALRAFFLWLAGQSGYRRKLSYSDADYFNLSEKDTRIAKAVREKPVPSLEQMRHVLACAPHTSDIECRDRALIALALLTGARDGALISLKVRHLDLTEQRLDFDAREVKTKFSKTFSTWFFPVGELALDIVWNWAARLAELHWGRSDPLFPATLMEVGPNGGFVAAGLDRRHWSTAEPVRRAFRQAFQAAGLPYFHPHTVRHTLVQLGERLCKTPEEFKAWSQNLGHDKVMTTFTSYGAVAGHRQSALIRGMAVTNVDEHPDDADELLRRLQKLIRHG